MPPLPGHDSDDEDESDDEDGYDLREVSSDVEVDPAELDIMEDDESGQDDSAYVLHLIRFCVSLIRNQQPFRRNR